MQTKQNSQQSITSDRIEANQIESRTHQKAISYETLYFSAKAAGINEPQYLIFAARQYYIGAVAMCYGGRQGSCNVIRKSGQNASAIWGHVRRSRSR
jgi:hypothetical protein